MTQTIADLITRETATLIGIVAGVKYYENPILGDEAPLMIKIDGRLRGTEYWELSDIDEDRQLGRTNGCA
tara:strand:- start:1417 stop:1626 length:210 start_codon:yes stop_codon:yes gene_type:complete